MTFHLMLRFAEGPPGSALPTVPFDQGKTDALFIYEPHHEKTCVRGLRPDTNWPAQPQRLARGLKFRL